jgi:demethoxyubiquinone hydroxylase (CLK1/Coq7/Cat5 family)
MEKKIFDYNSFIKENPVEKLAKATSTAVPEHITKEIEKHDNEAIETIEDPDKELREQLPVDEIPTSEEPNPDALESKKHVVSFNEFKA